MVDALGTVSPVVLLRVESLGDEARRWLAGLPELVLGDETQAYQYGHDVERDMAGWVERIGDRRWRMILPYPHYESNVDIIELIPAN